MKKTRNLILALVTLLLGFGLLAEPVFALGQKGIYDSVYENFGEEDVKELVRDQVVKMTKSFVNQAMEFHGKEAVVDLSYGRFYKLTSMYRDLGAYHKTGDFKQCIYNEYFLWHVPIFDAEGHAIMVAQFQKYPYLSEFVDDMSFASKEDEEEFKKNYAFREGNWGWFTSSLPAEPDIIDVISSAESLDKYLQDCGFKNIEYVNLLSVPSQGGYMVYVEDTGKGYGITFSKVAFPTFENGKIYEISNIVEVLEAYYKEVESRERGVIGGGVASEAVRALAKPVTAEFISENSIKPEKSSSIITISLICASTALLLAIAFVIQNKRQKANSK